MAIREAKKTTRHDIHDLTKQKHYIQQSHDSHVIGRCVAEHWVIISDEAVDTNSLHSALQVVETLFKKLIFRFLIASDMG